MCASVKISSDLLPFSGKTISYIRDTILSYNGVFKRDGKYYDLRKYSHILLQFGTVDVLTLIEEGVLDMVPPTSMCKCILNLCATIHKITPYSIILVSTILPIPKYPSTLTFIKEVNALVASELKYASRIIPVNSFSTFMVDKIKIRSGLFDEFELHLNSSGANALARRYRQAFHPDYVSDILVKHHRAKKRRKAHEDRSKWGNETFVSEDKGSVYPYIFLDQ